MLGPLSQRPLVSTRASFQRVPPAATTAASASLVFAYTFVAYTLSAGFTNDQFVYVSRAAEVVRNGLLPVRDFSEPISFLQTLLSAAALSLSDQTLVGEALFGSAAIAAAHTGSFLLVKRISGSTVLGLLLVLPAVLVPVRLYSYPKVLAPILVLGVLWWCVQAPGVRRLAAVGATAGFAFLLRHDLAAYAVPAILVALVILGGGTRLVVGRIAVVAAAGTATIAPMLFFVQATVGLPDFVSTTRSVVAAESDRTSIDGGPQFSRPFIVIKEQPGAPLKIRYTPSSNAAARADVEERYDLSVIEQDPGDPSQKTWSYEADTGRTLLDLVQEPNVEDTAGIDRETGQLIDVGPSSRGLLDRFDAAFIRLRLPESNAAAFLYYFVRALPLAVLLLLGVLHLRDARPRSSERRVRAAMVASAAVSAIALNAGLLRMPVVVRLPDVLGIAAVNAGCLWTLLAPQLAAALNAARVRARAIRQVVLAAVVTGVATVYALVVASSVGISTSAGGTIFAQATDQGLSVNPSTLETSVRARLGQLTNPTNTVSGVLDNVPQYVHACTRPGDLTLGLWFAPELYFYAQRSFAGRQVFYLPGYWDSEEEQLATVRALQRSRSPILVANSRQPLKGFPVLERYLRENYNQHPWPSSDLVVLTSREVPEVRQHAPSGLPCFA